MLFGDMAIEIHHQRNTYLDCKEMLESLKIKAENTIKTPRGLCAVYRDHIASMQVCQSKKKKQFLKKMEELSTEYSNIEQDSFLLEDIEKQEKMDLKR
mgnify:CR=1 FL=1